MKFLKIYSMNYIRIVHKQQCVNIEVITCESAYVKMPTTVTHPKTVEQFCLMPFPLTLDLFKRHESVLKS